MNESSLFFNLRRMLNHLRACGFIAGPMDTGSHVIIYEGSFGSKNSNNVLMLVNTAKVIRNPANKATIKGKYSLMEIMIFKLSILSSSLIFILSDSNRFLISQP